MFHRQYQCCIPIPEDKRKFVIDLKTDKVCANELKSKKQGEFFGVRFHVLSTLHASYIKCKNIFTKILRDVGMEVPKSIETRSKYTMHAFKGRGR